MSTNFIKLETAAELSSLIKDSHNRTIVVFKHSTTCGISAGVLREVSVVNGDIHMIVMQTQRPLAMELSQITGIRHESPQAIVLRNGTPVYVASHYDIQPDMIQSLLDHGPRD